MSVISSLLFSFPVFYFIIFYVARINPYICGMIILLSIPKHLMKQKFPKRHSGIYALMAGTALLAACHSSSESRHETGRVDAASTTHRPTGTINVTATSQAGVSSPVVYIYKMKKDYSKLVPVLMNEERTRIVSYPDPVDLQRGIGPTVAVLSYTYEEYIRLAAPPSREEMMERIVDKYPLTEIRAYGRRADYKDIVTELNEKIRREGWK